MPSKPPTGKRFTKGQSGNPKGSSAGRRIIGKLRKLTADELLEVGSSILHGDQKTLRQLTQNPDASVLELWTASLIIQSMKKGDAQAFKVLMERFLGRPRESITLSSDPSSPVLIQHMSKDEKLERLEVLRREREETGED
ncbi:MAG: hypothetical protein EOO38_00285 [Cytophagaceae bacterium]|nr:MAG: hypothetical protein EOO38_00285 [Cytophagaceae bacterium]